MTVPVETPVKPEPETKIRIEATLRVEVEFSVIGYFKQLTPDDRHRQWYWGLDLTEWGFDSEFERPIAWLTQLVSESYETTGMGGYPKGHPIRDRSDGLEFESERIEERNGVYSTHQNRHWTQEDFEGLVAAVPWLGKSPEAPQPVESLPLFPEV